MANSNLSPTIIADTSRVILENNLVMANKIHRPDDAFKQKIGTTYTIRLPNRWSVRSGKVVDLQDTNEPSSVITVATQKGVDFKFDSAELSLTIEEFADRYLKPAMSQLANEIEAAIAGLYIDVFNLVGTAGTTPSSYATSVQLVNTKMSQFGVPKESRCLVLEPDAYNTVSNGLSNLFVTEVSGDALRKGYIPTIGGIEIYESQNIVNHTVGSFTTGQVTEAAGAEGDTTTDTDGWASGATTLNKGDVYTVADVNAVNPQTRTSIGSLQQFVVTTQISDTAGDIDIPHSPTIRATGAFQTVDALVADEKGITMVGTADGSFPQNLAFHRDAFALAMVDLEMPQGVDFAARSSYKGISVRVVRAYDVNNDNFICRLDILYGVKTIYPELAVRLIG